MSHECNTFRNTSLEDFSLDFYHFVFALYIFMGRFIHFYYDLCYEKHYNPLFLLFAVKRLHLPCFCTVSDLL